MVITITKGMGLTCCTQEQYTADVGINHSANLKKLELEPRTDM